MFTTTHLVYYCTGVGSELQVSMLSLNFHTVEMPSLGDAVAEALRSLV